MSTTETKPTELANPAPDKNGTALAKEDKDYAAIVQKKILQFQQSGQLHLPPDYSPDNAVKAAWLELQNVKDKDQNPALKVVDNHSLFNSLLDMVVQGLSVQKKQGYFIVYGRRLAFQRSYFGDMALAQRVRPGLRFYYSVVYKGDDFAYEINRGRKRIAKHVQKLEDVNPSYIVAAYCVAEDEDGTIINSEVMPIEMIKKSWGMSKTYRPDGKSGTHHDFPEEMALRTVIRKTCKPIINGSSDALLMDAIRRSELDAVEAEVAEDALEHGNGEVLDIEQDEPRAIEADPTTGEIQEPEDGQPTLETAAQPEF